MKKHLLLGLGLLISVAMNAQVIFSGISPASIQGNYGLTYGKPSSSWGGPDLGLPINSVQNILVAYKTDSTACTSATNAAEIAGKIAVVYRADCEFGNKVMNAEAAGAIACVIINNIPGAPVEMGSGVNGPNVTIPVAMISDVDGATLLAEMKNGPVTVFIGNKQGFFANDLGLKVSQILRPIYAAVPSAIATNGAEYKVDLGGYAYNYGSNDQTNVKFQATITFNGTEVYNEVSTPTNILSGDSVLFSLQDFAPTTWNEGYYSLTYTVFSDAADDYDFDDMLESDFVISPDKLAYASFDETTMMPSGLSGLRPVDGSGNAIPHYSTCITFKDANASRLAPKSISFSSSKSSSASDPSLEGEQLLVQVYEYNDVFTDLTDPGFSNPIASYLELMLGNYQYSTDAANDIVTANFNNNTIVALKDNQRYLFCVNTFNPELYFGHDGRRDYSFNRDYYLQPMFPIEAGPGTFNPNGFGPTTVPGVTVGFIDAASVGLKNEKSAIKMNAYPSPASELLNVDFKSNEVSKVELVNMMGQTVVSQNVSNNAETVALNVASIENGLYIVKVYLTNNMTHTMQVVVNH